MNAIISGIHHVTGITADAQQNIDFYCGVLGLRLVKVTVNFDDPSSYHLYYGDELGHPGTIMTFFVWPGGRRGRGGPPQVTATAFAVQAASTQFWRERLREHRVEVDPLGERLDDRVLAFADPDGLRLEIVAGTDSAGDGGAGGPVAQEHAIRGFYGVTVSEEGYESTARLLTDVMGFRAEGAEANRFRYRGGGAFASAVDLLCVPGAPRGSMGTGVVHHMAFRTPDDTQQKTWREELVRLGYNVSPVMDRSYFHSIYYREPGGVLFEIATDAPGFAVDEPPSSLGTHLQLPPQFEPYRARLEKILPRLRLPEWHSQPAST